ncbi:MAG: hypothetical protein V7676_13665 [Parasphingorhabdus sp.]|uniref:hypothetical protein n=1 Tax=Parasphingorhabdus sp. TaxID=2709688 RepID=UPI0030023603
MQWIDIKIWLESSSGLDRDALHIYSALAIQLSFSLFFRRALGSPWPWIAVLVAELANEYVDLQHGGSSEAAIAIGRAASYHDMWNTMIMPTVLMVIARFWPRWMTGKVLNAKTVDVSAGPDAKLHPKTVN